MIRSALVLLVVCVACATEAVGQPASAVGPTIETAFVMALPPGVVEIAHEPVEDEIYVLIGNGDLYRTPRGGEPSLTLVATAADYGAPLPVYGMAIDDTGTIYIAGNRRTATTSAGVVRRGRAGSAGREWSTVVETMPYPYGRTGYDHAFSALAVHPSGTWLAINSGSRTDHGEVQDGEGTHPDVREVPLTSAIFRVSTNATDLVIPASSSGIRDGGFLFADGTRNSFGLAFDRDGELFGVENSGERDDGEELNWIRAGHHYGFPWRMGANDTPQQFPGYDPSADALVNPASGAFQNGDFYDDPTYPARPEGVVFTDPLLNRGPAADVFREQDGTTLDASDADTVATTFTPHRSPLGLVFRGAAEARGFERCDAFTLSWTDGEDGSGSLLAPLPDDGEDLLCLAINDERTEVEATQLVVGFRNPISSALVGSTLYVAEYGAPHGLWAVTFVAPNALDPDVRDSFSVSVAPNPLRTHGTLRVTLAEAGEARVRLVDVLGRTIEVLHGGPLAAGTSQIEIDTGALSAGVYTAIVEVEGASVARTFTISR